MGIHTIFIYSDIPAYLNMTKKEKVFYYKCFKSEYNTINCIRFIFIRGNKKGQIHLYQKRLMLF